jgi:predicted nucleotidyltransferase
MDFPMIEDIQDALRQVEEHDNVRVLYAYESGSRAWGFESPDSDYDVRFIYVRPRDSYLSIERSRDVIEAMLPNELDLSGWDLPKALGLLRKSNPPLLEWLESSIVYAEKPEFLDGMRSLADQCFRQDSCIAHFYSMAMNNWKAYLQNDKIPLKKYLYVLRPILAIRYLERFDKRVPMLFWDPESQRENLLDTVVDDAELRSQIEELLRLKMEAGEMGLGAPLPKVHEFIGRELDRRAAKVIEKRSLPIAAPLDEFFRTWLDDSLWHQS